MDFFYTTRTKNKHTGLTFGASFTFCILCDVDKINCAGTTKSHQTYQSINTIHKSVPNKLVTKNFISFQPPLSSTNFLYEIDKVTQAISKHILDSKQLNLDTVKFPDYPGCELEVGFMNTVNPQKLLRLRRQFLTYAKMNHSNEDASKIGRYFIQYLNKTLTD